MVDITIVNGVYKPTYNWGAPSCSSMFHECKMTLDMPRFELGEILRPTFRFCQGASVDLGRTLFTWGATVSQLGKHDSNN